MSTKPVINGKPATKAPIKAAAPAKVAVASAMPKAPAQIKLKVGQDVLVRSTRTGLKTKGRFVGKTTLDKSPGEWLKVNVAEKGKPSEVKHYRSAQVSAA